MSSPFNIFRKRQRAILVVVGVLCIFVFTVGDIILQWYQPDMGVGMAEDTVAVWKGGELNEGELASLRGAHQLTLMYLNQVVQETLKREGSPKGAGVTRDQQGRIIDPGISRDDSELRMVRTLLLAEQAEKMGMEVPDEAIVQFLAELSDRTLSSEDLRNLLHGATRGRLTRDQLFNNLRRELLARNYLRLAAAGDVMTPEDAWDYYNRTTRRLQTTIVEYQAEDFLDQAPQPKPYQVQEFYDKYKEQVSIPGSPEPGFKQRAKYEFAYFKADYDKFMEEEKAKISAEAVQEYYEDNKDRYTVPDLPEVPGLTTDDETQEATTPAESPKDEAPKEEAPKDEAPKEEAPKEETPKEETPKDEAPKDEAAPAEATPEEKSKADAPPAEDNEKSAPETPQPEGSEVKEPAKTEDSAPPQEPEGAETSEEPTESEDSPESPESEEPASECGQEGAEDETSEAPAENAPADEPETPKASAEKEPAETSPDETTPSETAPAEAASDEKSPGKSEPAASGEEADVGETAPAAEPKKEVKYRELSEVEDDIRRTLAAEQVRERIDTALRNADRVVDKYRRQYNAYLAQTARGDKGRRPEPPDFEQEAERLGLTFDRTPLISELTAGETELGQATTFSFAGGNFQQITFPQIAMQNEEAPLYQTGRISSGQDEYLFWPTKIEASHTPPLDEIRDEVVRAWRLQRAFEIAQRTAAEAAEKLRKAADGQPVHEVLKVEESQVLQPPAFSWMTEGQSIPFGGGQPRLSEVPGVTDAGMEFFETAFGLEPGQVGVAPNASKTAAYLVRVEGETPPEEVRRDTFWQTGVQFNYNLQYVAQLEQQRKILSWLDDLEKEWGLEWQRPPRSGAM